MCMLCVNHFQFVIIDATQCRKIFTLTKLKFVCCWVGWVGGGPFSEGYDEAGDNLYQTENF